MANEKQIFLKITKEQEDIAINLVGIMGATKTEVIRNIFLAWLSEKQIISDVIQKKMMNKQDANTPNRFFFIFLPLIIVYLLRILLSI